MTGRDPYVSTDAGTMPMGDGGDSTTPPSADGARTFFESQVAPVLELRCVACHGADRTGPPFLATSATYYDSVLSYPALVDTGSPETSRILTKGEHAGPAFTGTEQALVRAWIELEAASVGTPGGPAEPEELSTDPITPVEGFNAMDLGGMGMPGSSLSFIASRIDAGLFISELRVFAGPTGVRLVHPTLITWEGGSPSPDPVDRFSGIEVRVDPSSSGLVGSGSISLVGFPEDAELSFLFDEAGPMTGGTVPGDGDAGTPTGGDPTTPPPSGDGCSSVPSFTTNAQPQFSAFCVGCHAGGNATATAAVDMSDMGDLSPTAQLMACNQIFGLVDPGDAASSLIFRKPDPSSGLSHPFKFPSAAQVDGFRNAILAWIATE